MATNPELGRLRIPVVADLEPLKRQARTELRRAAEAAGREAAAAQVREMGRRSLALLRKEGADAARAYVEALRRRMERDIADAREALFRGLIDEKEYQRRAQRAARAFNDGVLKEIERRAASGQLTPRLHQALVAELQETGLAAGEGMSQGIRQRLAGLPGWVRGVLGAGLIGGFLYITTQVARLFRRLGEQVRATLTRAGEVSRIRRAFGNISASQGVEGGEVLEGLREATRGMVRDVDLMTRANMALQAGIPATAGALAELAYVSRRLAEAVGRDATEAFERLVNGIAKGEQNILEELGLLTRMETALRAWEIQTGRNSDALSQQEKILIFYNAVMDEARRKIAGMGEDALDAGQRIEQLTTFFANLKDAVAEAIAASPRIASFLEAIGVGAENSAAKVQDLADRVGAFVDTWGGSILGTLVGGGGGAAVGAGIGALVGGPAGFVVGGALGGTIGGFTGSAVGHAFDPGTSEEENLARRRREREERERMQEIRSMRDIVQLRSEYLRTLEREDEMTRSGAINVQELNRLYRERAAILEQIRHVQEEQGRTTGPTAEQIRVGKEALKELTASMQEFLAARELGVRDLQKAPEDVRSAIRAMVEAQEQIRQAEEQIAAARAAGLKIPEGAKAYLDHLRTVRDAAREAARELIELWQRELPAVVVRLEQTIRGGTFVNESARLAREVAEAERELTRARLAGDRERVARAERQLADARKALREHVARLAKDLESAGLPAEKLNEEVDRLVKLLRDAGIEVDGLAASERDWERVARSVEGVARGVLSVADAMGILDDRTRLTLQSVVDLAGGIASIASGNVLGGVAQTVGGIAGLVRSLFGDGNRRAWEERQLAEQQKIVRALERISNDLNAIARAYGDIQGALIARFPGIVERARAAAQAAEAAVGGPRGTDPESMREWRQERQSAFESAFMQTLQEELAALGFTMEDLRKAAESLGLEWGTSIEDVEVLAQAFAKLQLDKLTASFAGALERLRLEFELFDVEDPIQQLERLTEAFLEFSALPEELAKEIAGLDLSTAEGRRRFEEILQQLFASLASGDFDVGQLGSLTLDEWLQFLREAEGLLDQAGAGFLAGGEAETRLAVGITEVQANQLLAVESSQLFELRAIRALIAGGAAPATPAPTAAEAGALASRMGAPGAAGALIVTIQQLGVQIDLPGGQLAPGAIEEAGYRAGAAAAQGFSERLAAIRRAGGHLAPPRILVE